MVNSTPSILQIRGKFYYILSLSLTLLPVFDTKIDGKFYFFHFLLKKSDGKFYCFHFFVGKQYNFPFGFLISAFLNFSQE